MELTTLFSLNLGHVFGYGIFAIAGVVLLVLFLKAWASASRE